MFLRMLWAQKFRTPELHPISQEPRPEARNPKTQGFSVWPWDQGLGTLDTFFQLLFSAILLWERIAHRKVGKLVSGRSSKEQTALDSGSWAWAHTVLNNKPEDGKCGRFKSQSWNNRNQPRKARDLESAHARKRINFYVTTTWRAFWGGKKWKGTQQDHHRGLNNQNRVLGALIQKT